MITAQNIHMYGGILNYRFHFFAYHIVIYPPAHIAISRSGNLIPVTVLLWLLIKFPENIHVIHGYNFIYPCTFFR